MDFSIEELFIENYRCFKNFHLQLNPSLNIFVGANGTGKTSLLSVLKSFFFFDLFLDKQIGNSSLYVKSFPFKINPDFLAAWKIKKLSSKGEQNIQGPEDFYSISETPTKEEIDASRLIGKNCELYLLRDNSKYRQMFCSFIRVNGEIFHMLLPAYSRWDEEKYMIAEFANAKDKLISVLERKDKFVKQKEKQAKEATRLINEISKNIDLKIELTESRGFHSRMINKEGRDIEELSAGEKQLEELRIFKTYVSEVKPNIGIIDEPELHLNQGQMHFLSDLISSIKNSTKQTFIATHSNYFLSLMNPENLLYLQKDKRGYSHQLEIPPKIIGSLRDFLEAIFAEKIILVEGPPDRIFYERVLALLLKERYAFDLASTNTIIISVNGKEKFKKLFKNLSEDLKLDLFIIADLDLLAKESDYSFIGEKARKVVHKLTASMIEKSEKSSLRRFSSLSPNYLKDLLQFFDDVILRKKTIDRAGLNFYRNFRETIEAYVVREGRGIIHGVRKAVVRRTLMMKGVYLLNDGNLDSYLKPVLLQEGKASMIKIQSEFYPPKTIDLKKYINSTRKIRELSGLAELIYKWVRN